MGEVNGVDVDHRTVQTARFDRPLAYDYLILATGIEMCFASDW